MENNILSIKIMIRNLGIALNEIIDKINQIIKNNNKFSEIPFLIEKIDKFKVLEKFLYKTY